MTTDALVEAEAARIVKTLRPLDPGSWEPNRRFVREVLKRFAKVAAAEQIAVVERDAAICTRSLAQRLGALEARGLQEKLLAWAQEVEDCAEGAHAGINSAIQEMRAEADELAAIRRPSSELADAERQRDEEFRIATGYHGKWQAAEQRISDLMRERDAALAEARAWQPIETAPKDGTRFLIADKDREVTIGHWDRDEGYEAWRDDEWERLGCKPLVWMPLPAALVSADRGSHDAD